ncbi:MAG: hypothetical protein M3220_12245 [Chloroflexota bacterium]|nr:hypothetical protein [Chloroflexota bacterium]
MDEGRQRIVGLREHVERRTLQGDRGGNRWRGTRQPLAHRLPPVANAISELYHLTQSPCGRWWDGTPSSLPPQETFR